MRYLFIILCLLSCTALFGQDKKYIKRGNDLYKDKKYKEAEADYRKSGDNKGQNVVGDFNLGDALYKQKKYADANTQFNKLAETPNNKALAAAAYHNMGNSLLANNKLQESVDAYKKALLNNPKDDQTRYNLAYAEEKLKQQQQQQNKQNQQNKNQQNKDQNKQDQQNKDDKNKDNKDKDKQNQQNQNQDKKDQQNGQQPNQMSKEDAQRMLDALNNDEKQTQEKLKNKKFKAGKANITKDW
jgi:Ca-activated chloride channel family protein